MRWNFVAIWVILPAGLVLTPQSADASFHLMQIEQVIGGVNGDVTAQAIQLRTRALGQNLVSQARLVVRDANGSNPVTIINFTSNVANTAAAVVVAAAPPARPPRPAHGGRR